MEQPQAPFTDLQLAELQKPLSQEVVKTREQSGRQLSYVEGWWVIAEANRIFGFGSWNQDIVEIKGVSEYQRKIGQAKRDGWGVSYIARVRVTVNGVSREGVGAGHGIDVDLGQAHESAIKEAATDAMKRAFMTFGNQFGLALYDKEQRNVVDRPPSTTPLTEAEKNTQKFVNALHSKMVQVGLNSDGIATIMLILGVSDFSEVKEGLRPQLIERLTPEYAEKLNSGKNSNGVQVMNVTSSNEVNQ